MIDDTLNPADRLKLRFKARCAQTDNQFQNWQIRVHRSLSWYRRAWLMPDTENDVRFMVLWVAINSLYARWDNLRNTPHYDSDSRNAFLEMVYGWDQTTFNGLISAKRGLILKHLENPFLSGVFWRDPHHPDAKTHATEDARHLDNNFKNKSHLKVLKQAFDRLYVLRGQLMHGAATGGSKLNRKTLNYGVLLLMSVMPTILETTIDYGSHDDWHDLCYPPIST